MKSLLAVALLISLSGCSGLILREDDSALATTGKVATRVVLAPITILLSEVEIAHAKEREEQAIQQARYQRWYDSLSPERQAREDAKEAARINAAGLAAMGFFQSGGLRLYTPPPPAPVYQAPTYTPTPNQRCTYSRVGQNVYQDCY